MTGGDPRISVVVLTFNRRDELARTIGRLLALPERPAIVVVDNGSSDGTAAMVRRDFPGVHLVISPTNLGAAGRNFGVERVRTPYVAFCDDDTWWAPGALARAADVFDSHPRLGVLAARVLVGPENRLDPACERMAVDVLDRTGLPGPRLIAFMAGAAAMRVAAFRDVGGYEPRLFLGAEEALFAFDLAARGWDMAYVAETVVHHHASPVREIGRRRTTLARNRIWIAMLRLPWPELPSFVRERLREAAAEGHLPATLLATLRGMPWALVHRRVMPPTVHAMWRTVFMPAGPQPPPRRRRAVEATFQRAAPSWRSRSRRIE